MAKQYRKKQPKNSDRGVIRIALFMLSSFIGGYLCASLIGFAEMTVWVQEKAWPGSFVSAKTQLAEKTRLPKPKFEFYTLLTKEQTALPVIESRVADKNSTRETASRRPVVAKSTTAQTAPTKQSYLVQVASFKKPGDAEKMKASLILKGFNVSIASFMQNHVKWYRVQIGPYPSKIQAETAQIAIARTERVMGMIRKMDA